MFAGGLKDGVYDPGMDEYVLLCWLFAHVGMGGVQVFRFLTVFRHVRRIIDGAVQSENGASSDESP